MRTPVLIIACMLLSLLLAGCQYVETERSRDPGARASSDETVTETETEVVSTPAATPTPEGPDFSEMDWMQRGRLTVLIAGSDDAPDREGARTDAMIVATLDLETGQPILFSVPRNYGDIPLPDEIASVMGIETYTGMLKWLYGEAQRHPELAPNGEDPGMVALKGAISELLGIHIDYYAMVDMQGFIELVDALGGVDIDVQEPIIVRLLSPLEDEGWQQYEIMPGDQTLDGHEALAYSRSRTGTTDYDRMQRQRCLVQAVGEHLDLQTLLLRFPDLMEVVRDNVVTDIPLEMLPDLVMLREIVQTDQIVSIGFAPPEYHVGRSSGGHNLPAYDLILETVESALEDPDEFTEIENPDPFYVEHC
jgi:polyisoprenyl-teichoic acid--peptidoglycan teichoic acid transferase